MKDKVLPIGSIITVSGTDLMICSYFDHSKDYNQDKYDYICTLYPIGLNENVVMVKRENIDIVKFVGFQDSRFVELKKELEKSYE